MQKKWFRLILPLVFGLGLALLHMFLLGDLIPAQARPLNTDVSGDITSDTTWTNAGSPYVLTGDVVVQSGVVLTIEAGVVVQGNVSTALVVQGHLNAVGTPTQTITFTSSLGTPDGWDGLYFDGSAGQGTGHLRYAIVRDGGDGTQHANIRVNNVGYGQVIIESSQVISAVSSSTDHGVYVNNSNLVISDTLIASNGDEIGDYGLYATGSSPITITNSTFGNNAGYAARVEPNGPYLISGNTFSGNGYDRVLLDGATYVGDNVLPAQIGLESYELEGDMTVPAGFTLTVEAGVMVMGRDNARLTVRGHLDAIGTPGQPITFTSSSGLPNGWEGLYFYGFGVAEQGTGYLRHATVSNGGDGGLYANIYATYVDDGQVIIESSQVISASSSSGDDYGIYANSSNLVISDTLIANNGDGLDDFGLYATGGSPITMTNNIFENNAGYAARVEPNGSYLMGGNVFSGNGYDRVLLEGSAYVGDNILPAQSGLESYELEGDVTVPMGFTLTVESGVMVMGRENVRLAVRGHLEAVGTLEQPITFTSSSGVPDGWEGLNFDGGGTDRGTAHLRYVTVSNGGDNSQNANIRVTNVDDGQVIIESSQVISASSSVNTDYGIYASSSNLVISDTLIANNGDGIDDFGLYVTGGSPITMTNSTFENNAGYAARLEPDGPYLLSGNTFNGNGYDRVLLKGAAYVGDNVLPTQTGLESYELEGDITVPTDITLTVEPGVMVMGRNSVRLAVRGHLDAVGTPEQPITFTSSSGVPDSWEGLYFDGFGVDQGTAHLRHVTVSNGGNGTQYANIRIFSVQDGQVIIESSQVISASSSGNTDYGIYANSSNVVISDTLIADNGDSISDYGLYVTSGSLITITESIFQSNAGYGLSVSGSQVSVVCSSINSNGADGIYLENSAVFASLSSSIFNNAGFGLNNVGTVQAMATYNFWGDPSGPGGIGPGIGDEVSANVDYIPWLEFAQCVVDLSLTKVDDHDPAIAGTPITYTLAVVNAGPGDGSDIVLTDFMPDGFEFISADVSQGSECEEADGDITCELGDLLVDGQAAISITMRIDPFARGTIINNALITATQTDYRMVDNSVSEPTYIDAQADLSLIKMDDPDPVEPGGRLIYELQVANEGPSAALNTVLVDTLPATGIIYISAVTNQGTCEHTDGVVTCSLGDLPPDQIVPITITVDTDETMTDPLLNQASVTSNDPDPDESNNTAEQITVIGPYVDLALSMLPHTDQVIAGNPLTYTLTITNHGPYSATNVTLTDTLPAELTYVSAISSQGTCSQANGIVVCDLGNMVSGAQADVVIQADTFIVGPVLNYAEVSSDEFDILTENNVSTYEIQVLLYYIHLPLAFR